MKNPVSCGSRRGFVAAIGAAIVTAATFPLGMAAGPASAATILDQSITVAIRPDGSVAEHQRIAVRLYTARDLAAWSPYPIDLGEDRRLVRLEAYATEPGGRVVQAVRRGLQPADPAAPAGEPGTRGPHSVEIPVVLPGAVLTLDYEIEERPHFPSGSIRLDGTGDRIDQLHVEVGGAGAALPGWRWRLDGPRDGLLVAATPQGVKVTASDLPAVRRPAHAPEFLGAVLRYSWGPVSTWQGIGRWYESLLAALPHGTPAVRKKAQEIAGGIAGRRQKIEALAAFVRRDVRYVTSERAVGTGGAGGEGLRAPLGSVPLGRGYRPAPPEDVLSRRSGDCKDKSVLLVDLLAAVEVEAYPALLRMAPTGRLDADFPAPNEFNHLIVAVPTAGLALTPDDPESEGFLFIDPTETLGSAFWLPSYDQDQEALVVRGEGSVLVHTAVEPAAESQRLEVNLATTVLGDAVGQASLELTGEAAATWVSHLGSHRPEENAADAQALLAVALPGAALTHLGVKAARDGVPSFRISAQVQIPGLLPGDNPARSFRPASLHGLPPPSLLDNRKLAVVLTPQRTRSLWRIQLPPGTCPPAPQDETVENHLGSFRQRILLEGGLLTVERNAELTSRWIEPDRFPALQELARAEYRTGGRLVRLECAAKPSGVTAAAPPGGF